MSLRAGQIALGFNPITDFIEDISQQAMKGVGDINDEALALALISVAEHRAQDAYHRFCKVMRDNDEAQFISSLDKGMESVSLSLKDKNHESQARLRRLISLLDEMDQCMLSARSIASVSRVITADTGEYAEKLSDVAENLDVAATTIKQKIDISYKLLDIS
jgi:hypothetical protein